jgi:tetratricopeptide (TPR) repeat protein
MDKHDLLERYEARSEERDFLAAKPLYEQALTQNEDAQLLLEYGYLLECHARNELRHAAKQYRRAVELDPALDKARYQLIQALAALFDTDEMIALYKRRVAAAPGQAREYRFLASALLAAGRAEQARTVIDTGLALDPADRTLIAQRAKRKQPSATPTARLPTGATRSSSTTATSAPSTAAPTSSSAKEESKKRSRPGGQSSAGTSKAARRPKPSSPPASSNASASKSKTTPNEIRCSSAEPTQRRIAPAALARPGCRV